jgi:hypothetical protein
MIRNHILLSLALTMARTRREPVADIALERQRPDSAIALADPGDPIGVSADGLVVARLAGPNDSSYRLVDSTGRLVAVAAVTGVGTWLASDDGLLYTMAADAKAVLSVRPDGSAGPSYSLSQPGVLRGVWGDSVDLVRPGAPGISVVRLALGTGAERVMIPEGAAEMGTLLDISPRGGGARSQLASITTTSDRVVVGNGETYRMLLYSTTGAMLGTMGRAIDSAPRLGPRRVEAELRQIRGSDSTLTEKYLSPGSGCRTSRRRRECATTLADGIGWWVSRETPPSPTCSRIPRS